MDGNAMHWNDRQWNSNTGSSAGSSDVFSTKVLSRVRRQFGQNGPIHDIPAYEENVVPLVVLTALTFIGVFLVLPVLLLAGYLMGKRPARLPRRSHRVHPLSDGPAHPDGFEMISELTQGTQIALNDGDDIMKDLRPGDVPFVVKHTTVPEGSHSQHGIKLKPRTHHPVDLENPPIHINPTDPEDVPNDLKTKGMQTDPRSKSKRSKPKNTKKSVGKAVSNLEIYTPNNNKMNPFRPVVSASDTVVMRKRPILDHLDDKDKAVQTSKDSFLKPPPPDSKPHHSHKSGGGKPLTSTKPNTDTRPPKAVTPTERPQTNSNNDGECEVCPGFNPSIRLTDLTWLQLFQYMQADGGWFCTDDNRAGASQSTRRGNNATNTPVTELYNRGSVLATEPPQEEEPQQASLSKKPHKKRKAKK